MEASKSSTINDGDNNFLDALVEFPFDDSVANFESDHSVSISLSSSISGLGPIENNANGNMSIESNCTPEFPSLAGIRRRRSFSQQLGKNISRSNSKDANPDSSVSFDPHGAGTAITATSIPLDRMCRFSRILKESEKLGSHRVRFSSDGIDKLLKEETNESSTITTATDEIIDDSITVDSRDSSSNLLFFLARLVTNAIGFQINLLVSFVTSPIWLLYFSYKFVIDPFRVMRRGRGYLMQKLSRIWGLFYDGIRSVIYGWLKKHKRTVKLALTLGWGFLWAAYVCFVLFSLLFSAFIVSGIIMKYAVEEPIQMEEQLNFDYTRESPSAFVPLISCPELSCGVDCSEKIEHDNIAVTRVVPLNHKLQVAVSLTLPESDYNRNLGIFQVRVDFLSTNGKALASSRQPCMLQFQSEPIRLLLTFLKLAPLLTGYLSESQTLNIKFRGFTERDMPTSCLRVVMEQRAEFRAGAGIPEIYGASLNLESEQPLLKRILWSWKRTLFIWASIVTFTIELLFTLVCCKPIIVPNVRLRGGSPDSNASQNVRPSRPKGDSPDCNASQNVHPAKS